MKKKAIAYVSDIILGRTGEVISRNEQKQNIEKYANENEIEVIAWFEDEIYNEDVITRPGIQDIFAFEEEYDIILVERVWSFSRKWSLLNPFFKELENRNIGLESASMLWDCVSQKTRHHFRKLASGVKPQHRKKAIQPCVQPVQIAKPRHLVFSMLRHRLNHA